MAATGLLSALQGRDNFDVVRQERQRELQLATLQNFMAKQDLQEQQLAAQEIGKMLSLPGNIKVLDPAIKGIQDRETELSRPIMEGIMKANGNVKQYLRSGGLSALKKYQNDLVNDPLVAKGIMSAANYNKMVTDIQAGLVPRGTAEEDLNKYMQGETDTFGYRGAYKMPDLDKARHYFGTTYGKNPYKPQPVDEFSYHQFVESESKNQGLSPEDAKHAADRATKIYKDMVKQGGQPYMFGSKQWKPPTGWGAQADNEEAMKYILEGAEGALKPAETNPDFWDEKYSIPNPASYLGFSAPPLTMYGSSRLRGLPLGKATIAKYKYDGSKKKEVPDGVQQIDNTFQGFAQDEDGNTYYHTSKSDLEGKRDRKKMFIPFTDASIDELVLGAPAATRPKLAAALRKGLKAMNAYKNLTPSFNKGDKYSIGGKTYTLKELTDMGYTEADVANYKVQ